MPKVVAVTPPFPTFARVPFKKILSRVGTPRILYSRLTDGMHALQSMLSSPSLDVMPSSRLEA